VASTRTAEGLQTVCRTIVHLIQAEDLAGQQLLSDRCAMGMRFLANRECRAYADECVQLAISEVVTRIAQGELESPEKLPSFIRIILYRVIAERKQAAISSGEVDTTAACQAVVINDQNAQHKKVQLMAAALRRLPLIQREILKRMYVLGQNQEEICREMQLHKVQFLRLKTAAKKGLNIESPSGLFQQ